MSVTARLRQCDSYIQCTNCQVAFHVIACGPADDAAGIQISHRNHNGFYDVTNINWIAEQSKTTAGMVKFADISSTVWGGRVTVRLIREVEKWSRPKAADVILFFVTSGQTLARTDRFFKIGNDHSGRELWN